MISNVVLRFMTKRAVIAFLFVLPFSFTASAQRLAVKTNLLHDATATINIGLETSLAPKWSLEVSGGYNAWDFEGYRKWKHWLVQPEARFWFCETFNGHFIAAHVLGGEYNMVNPAFPFSLWNEALSYRNEGWYYGAGIAYGYHWILGNRWSIETEIGVGYLGSDYDRYVDVHCGEWLGNFHRDAFGITKLAVSVVFLIM